MCRSYVIKLGRWRQKKIVILRLKLRFFLGFKNDNILSSKSNTVTKSEISPQQKLGSLQNLKQISVLNALAPT